VRTARPPRQLWQLLLDAAAWAVLALFFAAQGYLSSAHSGRPASWSSAPCATFPAGHAQGYGDPFSAFVADAYDVVRGEVARSAHLR